MTQGYYRFPSVLNNQVVFVAEDDLWTVPLGGGEARRLTSGLGTATRPAISPDGKWIAFSGTDEGHLEVFVMPSEGGPSRRLTHIGGSCRVLGWSPEGHIIFASHHGQPFVALVHLYTLAPEGGEPKRIPVGPAVTITYGPNGGIAIGRNETREPSTWKRYRGGTAGDLWVDPTGQGEFRKLVDLPGNLTHPMWIGERIYFFSDHEGFGNLYSTLPTGQDVKRHTDHEEFYVRHPSTDGQRIAYDCGADLYCYDPDQDRTSRIEIAYSSPRSQAARKFVPASRYFEDYAPHPDGDRLATTIRGKTFAMGNWEAPVLQIGQADGVRYRLPRWLHDGKRIVVISDGSQEERLEIFDLETAGAEPQTKFDQIDVGRATDLKASPKLDQIVLSNHRSQLIWVDLAQGVSKVLDQSVHGLIQGFDWSPDGAWIAYGFPISQHLHAIKVCQVATGKTWTITRPVLKDAFPAFDPEGKYLYFLSHRFFNPVYDAMQFELGFPRGMKPCLLTLRKDVPNPFVTTPKPLEAKASDPKASDPKSAPPAEPSTPSELKIDFDGIEDRVLAFPVPDSIYTQIEAGPGRVYFVSTPIEGSLDSNWYATEPPTKGTLETYDFATQKCETWATAMTEFKLTLDRKTLLYRSGNRLRIVKATSKPDEAAGKEGPSRTSGWVDLSRIKVSILPPAEWKQMYSEAWRLQRDHFWTEDMSQVDWRQVHARYLPLLSRIGSRSEYSDLVWDMQGELGTSHAYEIGGDYRPEPRYEIGFLGADLAWDASASAFRIDHIVNGDSWDESRSSPLSKPGLDIQVGHTLLAINGRALSQLERPESQLVHQAGAEVRLTIGDAQGKNPRTAIVKTMRGEMPARYREWVEKNRRYVHDKSQGKLGYVHIPNMGPLGFSEFHRYYLSEVERDGLIVDVRFNGGGHVSQLLLEKLARKRIGYDQSRWFGVQPYPSDSVDGPLVALTNQNAGSDGDIFSHCFKLMKLGPLIGKRTWGGVVGIWPRSFFVDGSLTTQPEFSFWFKDVGWTVENFGTEPDIEVEIRPQDAVAGRDPQLDRGIMEALGLLKSYKKLEPDLRKRPDLKAPSLPKRAP